MADMPHTPAMWIGGCEHRPNRPTRVYRSPATGLPVSEVVLGTPGDVDAAVAAAVAARPVMAALDPDECVRRCDATAQAIERNSDRLARILADEHGKPLHTEAMGEVFACAQAFRDAGAQARWLPVTHVPLSMPNKQIITRRRPRGVYGVVTPWNFPIGTATMYYLAPGLASGNTIVWVGAPSTSAVQSELARVLTEYWPAGALNLVTGDGPIVGQHLVAHPQVDAVGFTGSTPVGLEVARAAIGKPCLLELGGNGPTLVLNDADVGVASERIASGSFTNAGQICTATGRILAHRRVAADLADAIAEHARKFTVGAPDDPATVMGPVHLSSLADRVLGQIHRAAEAGASIVTGGDRLADAPTPNYVLPTVVAHVPAEADLHIQESFGPVAPIVPFDSDQQMWQLVHASQYGLHAAVFSRDIERCVGIAAQLRAGHVNINDTSAYWEPSIPAGGAAGSASGVGRTGGPWSVQEMTEVLTMTVTARDGNASPAEPRQ